jgi:glutaconate CoA-transferase subunit B
MPGAAPERVITDKSLCGFDAARGEMVLESLHPGVELADVLANVGWELRAAAHLGETPPPTAEELRILREELDPQGIYRR